MALSAGTRLGPYEILALLGKGGMGEVYRARDPRIGRTVAIKVSQEQFSERFEREARAVGALNNPHICQLYDVGPDFLVMECVDGVHLKGPLPLAKAIEYACQILDALDAAHCKGITHRDLKPSNILVTRQGIKLLDFGLAKHSDPVKETDSTLTAVLTGMGQIVGTLQYMSPEQLHGKEADARSDLFGFGCVLYELLTGKRAFEGQNAASVIAAILERDAPSVAGVAPASLNRLLGRCFAKDPEERWQNARDLKHALEQVADEKPPQGSPAGLRPWAAVAATLLLGLAVGFAIGWFRQVKTDSRSYRVSVALPPGVDLPDSIASGGNAISPDGRMLAFVARSKAGNALWLRPLDSFTARELPGSGGATFPFWSPDSRSLGFFAGGKLKTIEASGGEVRTLCEVSLGRGGSWNSDGVIIFGSATSRGLHRVAAAGGTSAVLTAPDSTNGEIHYRWPAFLHGGRRFMFFLRHGNPEQSAICSATLDQPLQKTCLVRTGFNGAYATAYAGRPGYLLWVREGTLMAQPLDEKRWRVLGDALPLVQGVATHPGFSLADLSVSDNGVLFYGSGSGQQMTWLGRDGKLLGTAGFPGLWSSPRISPDGKRVAATQEGSGIWLLDNARGILSRFTFSPTFTGLATWSPDGRQIAFTMQEDGPGNIYVKNAIGANQEERLTQAAKSQFLFDWSRDGQHLLFREEGPQTGSDLWILPLTGVRKPIPFAQTRFNEQHGTFSPNGHWIAYTSDESGRDEVYVQPFPPSGAKWEVSAEGGSFPRWRDDGKELFYLSANSTMMVAETKGVSATFEAQAPRVLFPVSLGETSWQYPYDVTRDGQRFLVVAPSGDAKSQFLTVVINWQGALKP